MKKRMLGKLQVSAIGMPMIGFGTYRMPPRITQRCVEEAIGGGYRHTDTAQCCGNEREVGQSISSRRTSFVNSATCMICSKIYGTAHEAWSPLAAEQNGFFTNPTMTELARRYEKSIAQIGLKFPIQQDIIAIPKSTHIERMRENLDLADFELTATDMARLRTLDKRKSLFNWW